MSLTETKSLPAKLFFLNSFTHIKKNILINSCIFWRGKKSSTENVFFHFGFSQMGKKIRNLRNIILAKKNKKNKKSTSSHKNTTEKII